METLPPNLSSPMPYCRDSEMGVISCALSNPAHFDDAARTVNEEHFFIESNQIVWQALAKLREEEKPSDTTSLIAYLRERNTLDKIGGVAALVDFQHSSLTTVHFQWCIDRLVLMHTKRQAIRASWAIVEAAHDLECDDRMKLVGRAEEAVNGLHSGADIMGVKSFNGWMTDAIDFVESQIQRGGSLSGFSTGIPALDSRTMGLGDGEAWIIAGGTSDGKTGLAMQIARSLFSESVPTAYYLTESSGVRLTLRVMASVTRIPLRSMFTGSLTTGEQMSLTAAMRRMSSMPFHLRHCPGISLFALLADMRMMSRKHGVKVFFVDYIQRVDNSQRENREQQIAEISRRLTDYSNKNNKNVVMLSQLNDNGAVRESRSPTHDADVMLTISCPVEKDARGTIISRDENRRYLTVNKARNAERGGKPILFHFNGSLQTFTEIEEEHASI